MVNQNTFQAFAPGYIVKAGNKITPYRVGGILSTEDRDIDGEILKDVDYSYFKGGFGKVKYEHDEIKGPAAIIGFPVSLMKKGKETHFEADLVAFDPDLPEEKLTPQQKLAKSTVTLMQHMEEFNKNHPNEIQQKAGWSVEGAVIGKDKKTGVVKAVVSDVVFTTKPRNRNTLAKIIKSLSVGYGMTPETQTGFGSTRKESLEGSVKNHQSKGEFKMKTKNDVYREALTKGLSKQDALKEAEEFEKNQKKEMDESCDKVEKSLTASREALKKSLDSVNEVKAIESEIDTVRGKLKKSLSGADTENFDATNFLIESSNTSVKAIEMVEQLSQNVEKLAKSLAARAEADTALVDAIEYISKVSQLNGANINNLNNGLGVLAKGLSGQALTIPSEQISNAKVDDNDDPTKIQKSLSKADTKKVINSLIEKGELSKSVIEDFEVGSGYMTPETAKLVKSRASEILS